MICPTCGKELLDGEICENCNPAKEAEIQTEAAPQSEAPVGSRMTGFKPALIGAIFAFVGNMTANFVLSFTTTLLAELESMLSSGNYYIADEATLISSAVVGIMFAIAAIGLSVPAVILGIKSIITFVREAKRGAVKPIATIILGAAAVGLSFLTVIFSIATFATSGALLGLL